MCLNLHFQFLLLVICSSFYSPFTIVCILYFQQQSCKPSERWRILLYSEGAGTGNRFQTDNCRKTFYLLLPLLQILHKSYKGTFFPVGNCTVMMSAHILYCHQHHQENQEDQVTKCRCIQLQTKYCNNSNTIEADEEREIVYKFLNTIDSSIVLFHIFGCYVLYLMYIYYMKTQLIRFGCYVLYLIIYFVKCLCQIIRFYFIFYFFG